MRIFNEQKTEEIINPDLTKGYLKEDKLFIKTIPAVEEVAEQWHYETVREYPNGGKDIERVIDVPAVEAKPSEDVFEDIQVYILFTKNELESQYKHKRSKYLDAYRKYQAAVNYGEFERVQEVDDFIELICNKDWKAFDEVPPQLQYFMDDITLAKSKLLKIQKQN